MTAQDPLRVVAWPYRKFAAANPYQALLYDALEARGVAVTEFSWRRIVTGRCDVWHIHWPDGVLNDPSAAGAAGRVLFLGLLFAVARMRGIKVLWTVHNLGSHEKRHPWIERLLWHLVTARVDATIHMSVAGHALAEARFPKLAGRASFTIPHGHYRTLYPRPMDRAAARARLGIPDDRRVVAYFGQIRAYKNIPALVAAYRETAAADTMLVIAGTIKSETLKAAILAAVDARPDVMLLDRFLSDDDLHAVVRAADLVVLSYIDVLNSGSLMLALSLDRPVLAPALGAIREIAAQVGGNWVHLYDGGISGRDLARAIAAPAAAGGERPDLERFDWAEVAAETENAIRQVVARPRHG